LGDDDKGRPPILHAVLTAGKSLLPGIPFPLHPYRKLNAFSLFVDQEIISIAYTVPSYLVNRIQKKYKM
jgi:hypothetical protein